MQDLAVSTVFATPFRRSSSAVFANPHLLRLCLQITLRIRKTIYRLRNYDNGFCVGRLLNFFIKSLLYLSLLSTYSSIMVLEL